MRAHSNSIVTPLVIILFLTGCAKREIIRPPAGAIVVAQDGTGDFRSIAQALMNAQAGEIIFVKPGRWTEVIELKSVPFILIGAGPDRTTIDANGQYACLTLATDGSHVAGFALTNAGSHGIYVKDGNHTIENCLIYGNNDRGIYLSDVFGKGTATINHCTIVDNRVSGIYTTFDTPVTRITNCIIAFNDRGVVADENKGRMNILFNCLYNKNGNFDGVLMEMKAHSNIEDDPKFVDPKARNYKLSKDSPCLNAASDGKNMGAFSNYRRDNKIDNISMLMANASQIARPPVGQNAIIA